MFIPIKERRDRLWWRCSFCIRTLARSLERFEVVSIQINKVGPGSVDLTNLSAMWAVLLLACVLASSDQVAAFQCESLLKTATFKKAPFTGCQELKANKAVLLWRSNGVDITLRLMIREIDPTQRGWMAVGLSDMGSMKGADIALIHKSTANKWTVTDCQAHGFFQPTPDKSQDWRLHNFQQTGVLMSATMSRKLKTCDFDSDMAIRPGLESFIIWANGPAYGTGFDGVSYHGTATRGNFRKQLLDLPAPKSSGQAVAESAAAAGAGDEAGVVAAALTGPAAVDSRSQEEKVAAVASRLSELVPLRNMDVLSNQQSAQGPTQDPGVVQAASSADGVPEVHNNGDGTYWTDILCKVDDIPAEVTTYMHCYVKLPADRRYYITKYTTIYGTKLVHHSVVYACLPGHGQLKVEELIAKSGPGPYNLNDIGQQCEAFYLIGPAPNAPDNILPAGTGLPFGNNSYEYFELQVHYNNPEMLTGQKDPGTGLRLYFQPDNLLQDVGLLTISQVFLNIPPGKDTVVANTTFCPSQCTKRFTEPVTIIGQFPHMHGLGKSIITKRVKQGVEQPPLLTLKSFDYNYQTWIDVPDDQQTLYPGEELSLTCVFDSSSRTETTQWGYSTTDEMCFWWIYYYPAQPLVSVCTTFGDTPLALCSDSITYALDLIEAWDSGNQAKLGKAVGETVDSGRGFYVVPQPVNTPYNETKGCSAQLPAP